jgi:diguanylate cyclase (GGDEF)-like protein
VRRGLCGSSLAAVFPFYIAFDENLRIEDVGPALSRMSDRMVFGACLADAMALRSPRVELTAESLRAHPLALYLFDLHDSEVTLRGQVVYSNEQSRFVFVGSPWIRGVDDLRRLGLSIGDFAAHDPTIEYLLLRTAEEAAAADARRMLIALQDAEAERERLAEDEGFLEDALNASADLRIRVSGSGVLLELRVASGLGVWSREAPSMIGQPLSEVLPELVRALEPLEGRFAESSRPQAFELRGRGYFFECRVLKTPAGETVVVGRDVTDRRGLEEMLRHQALHDALTGLPNRVFLQDRLDDAIRVRSRRGEDSIIALLLIDLDDFKGINDVLGHGVGDEVLVNVARRIDAALRPTDCAARLGGDEFAVFLDDIDYPSQALEIACRLRERIGQRLSVAGADIRPSASIGVAITSGGECDGGTLTRQADLAMYRSKASMDGGPALFNEAMQQEATQRLELKQDLEIAVERDEFVLHYQPVVDLDTGGLVGVEALVRWQHPRHGLMSPFHFIEIAEESGIIVDLGRRILELACEQAARWEALLPEANAISLAVNLSAKQLRYAGIKEDVLRSLESSGLPARRLTLEITESHVVSNVEQTVEILSELRALGARIAMDDFGTGYSALSYLERLPIDVLKIDKAFVDRLAREERAPLAEAVVGIGHSLGMQVVAEGIEHSAQAAALRELGCRLGQGYLFSPPVDAETITAWLESSAPSRPIFEEKSEA